MKTQLLSVSRRSLARANYAKDTFMNWLATLAKLGVADVDSNLATAIRTSAALVFARLIAIFAGGHSGMRHVLRKAFPFLVLSGSAIGASTMAWIPLSIFTGLGVSAEISGTVRLAQRSMPVVDPEKYGTAPYSSISLCSQERAYRVEGDRQGNFKIENVHSGTYDLVAVAPGYAPEMISTMNVIGDESIGPMTALVHGGPRTSPCWVNSSNQSVPYHFEVNYGPANPSQTGPVIRGEAGRWAQESRTKPLQKARIDLFRAGDLSPVNSTESDKDGRFTMRPPTAGIYELLMSRKGYRDVRVPAFLVPRENVTMVDLSTSDEGRIFIYQ